VEHSSIQDQSFWPAFSDMMLGVVLVMTLVLFLVARVVTWSWLNMGTHDLSSVIEAQHKVVRSLSIAYGSDPVSLGGDSVGFFVQSSEKPTVLVVNATLSQTIKFYDEIVFGVDSSLLNPDCRRILRLMGDALRTNIGVVSEIQIHGHSDASKFQDSTGPYPNMGLAATRAISVYGFLKDSVGIDPLKTLMSATSFGEYVPNGRVPEDTGFTIGDLKEANSTGEQKRRNRRTEVRLLFKLGG